MGLARTTSLPLRFAVGSLVAFLLVGATLSIAVYRQLQRTEQSAAQAHAEFVTDAILRYQLTPDDLAAPMTGPSYDRLLAFVRTRILRVQFPVVRIKVWRSNGLIVFSDEPSLVGRRFPVDEDLAQAFQGETISEVTDLTSPENLFERSLAPKLFSAYVPLYLDPTHAGERPDAVVELYADYAGIQTGINRLLAFFLLVLLGGLGVLYVLLLPIVRRAAHTLKEQNTTLEHQARRLEELLIKERETVSELTEANRRKDEFIAVVSHELRTPLTAITGYLGMLAVPNRAPDPGGQQEFIHRSLEQAHQLGGMVENLLAASVLNQDVKVSVESFVLHDVVDAALEALGEGRERVRLDLVQDLPPLATDRKALQQILGNLLDNALKFSPEDSACELSAHREGPSLAIGIHDHGIGIPTDEIDRIFERFYQVDSSATRRYGGMGLGLAVVKTLVALLGGSIELVSTPEEGSLFTVYIPLVHPTVKVSVPASA